MGKKIEFTVTDKSGLSAQLSTHVAGLSRANADKLVKSGEVKINGIRTKTNEEVAVGDIVSAFVPDALIRTPELAVVYEDENIIIFDKPKMLPFDVIPQLWEEGKKEKIYAVHRLDTNTTGIIVFAKTESAKTELERAFKTRAVQKTYTAVVYPAPKVDGGVLTAYTAMQNGTAQVSGKPRGGYKTMITEYFVKERIGGGAALCVMPHTGRTHQIRAHMKFIGSPIVGDPKYGGKKLDGAPDTQMLAAVKIRFDDLGGGLEYLNGKEFSVSDKFDLSFM